MEHGRNIVKANDEVIGREVRNREDECLGKIKEIVLDKLNGRAVYVVLDSGSFLGMGGKYFALPWGVLDYDSNADCFRVDINKERLKNAPGFDKDHWPNMADRTWTKSVHEYYGFKDYLD